MSTSGTTSYFVFLLGKFQLGSDISQWKFDENTCHRQVCISQFCFCFVHLTISRDIDCILVVCATLLKFNFQLVWFDVFVVCDADVTCWKVNAFGLKSNPLWSSSQSKCILFFSNPIRTEKPFLSEVQSVVLKLSRLLKGMLDFMQFKYQLLQPEKVLNSFLSDWISVEISLL